jgi:ABC-2 type transport system ATP-binding protein
MQTMSPNGYQKNRMQRNNEPIIQANGLTKRYGSAEVVKDVSFEVRRGDVFGFLGPNGSGKSTTIGMLLGLVQPTSGSISLFGGTPEDRADGLARVGAIIESPAFYPYMSGRDNLKALGYLRPGVTNARIDEVLDIVGLREAASKKYGNYSLGMKQRLGIGWTLLHDPELLVLDEPTNGLDPAGMQEVRHLILRLAEQGKTIFISSHLLNEIEQVCDNLAIIQRGRIIATGSVTDLVGREQRLIVRTPHPDIATEVLSQIEGVERVERRGSGSELAITAPTVRPSLINALLVGAGVEVDELRLSQSTLEQAFLELTGDGLVPEQQPAVAAANSSVTGSR